MLFQFNWSEFETLFIYMKELRIKTHKLDLGEKQSVFSFLLDDK